MCTVLLPPGVNPITVNKYIIYRIMYHISYHIIYRITYIMYCISYIYHIIYQLSVSSPRGSCVLLSPLSDTTLLMALSPLVSPLSKLSVVPPPPVFFNLSSRQLLIVTASSTLSDVLAGVHYLKRAACASF